jgi:hypothetical protein
MMDISYYMGSYYVTSEEFNAIFKITATNTVITSIQIVDNMPVIGEYVDPQDEVMQAVWDNFKVFIEKLSTEA